MTEIVVLQGKPAVSIPDVPDVSARWYLDVVEWAGASPGWAQSLLAVLTEAVVGLFAVLFAVLWWRARHGPPTARRRALLAPVVTVLAYLVSEAVKAAWQQDRPCRVLPEAVPIVECPELGDWSFPSNHSTIAAAAAVAVLRSSRVLGAVAVAAALFAAASRVLVGVHYPHDAVAGLALGTAVAAALLVLTRPLTRDRRSRDRRSTVATAPSTAEETVRLR